MPPSFSAQARRDERGRAILPAGLTGLGNRFIEVLGRRLPRRHFAAEMARLISEALRCRAVAVLAYDSRRGRLSLLADSGLPTAARDALGGSQDCSWDIPLHGLHNRRISVIEAAHQNPFVPRSLIGLSPNGLCVACLPVYYDLEPVGTVLLFAAGARAFPDGQLQMLSQALRSCARGLRDPDALAARALRARVPEEPQPAEPAADQQAGAVAATPPTAEPAPPRAGAPIEAQQAPDLVARIQFLEQGVTQAQADVERSTTMVQALTTSAHALARERDGFARQLEEVQRERETEIAALRAQLAALEERLLAADSDRSRYQRAAEARHAAVQQSLGNVQQERDALAERLRVADATAAALNADLQQLRAEREQLSAQVDRLTAQVRADEEALRRAQALHADERTVLEADRDAWKQQTATARAELAARAEQLLGLDRELHSAVVGREGLAAQLQATRHELGRLTALAEELSDTATQAETARAAAVAETVALRRTAEDERTKHAEIERVLRADVAAVRDDADRLSATAAALREQIAERTHLLAEREKQLASLRDAQDAARHAETTWQQTSASLHAEIATLTARLEQSAAEQQQVIEELRGLRDELRRAAERNQDLGSTIAELQRDGQAAQLENVRLQDTLQEEQAARLQVEERLHAEVSAARAEVECTSASGAALRDELAQRDRLLTEREGRVAGLQAHEAELQETIQRLVDERTRLDAGKAAETAEIEALRITLSDLQETIVQLESQRDAMERARSDTARRLAETEQRLEELSTAVRQREATAAALAAERQQLVARLAEVTAQLEATEAAQRRAAEERTALEAERHRWNEEATATGAELERLSATAEERQRSIEQLQTAQAAALTESAGLRQALEDEAERRTAVQRELVEVQTERDALREQHVKALAASERERAEVHEALHQLTEQHQAVQAGADAHQRDAEAHAAKLAQVSAELEVSLAERERAQRAQEELQQQTAELQRQIDALRSQVAERDTWLQAAVAQRDAFQENIRGVETAVAQLTVQRDELVRKTQDVLLQLEQERRHETDQLPSTPDIEPEPELAVSVEEIAPPETPLVIERSAPLGAVTDSALETVEPESAPSALSRPAKSGRPLGELVLVDEGARSDEAYQSLKGAGFEVAVVPPTETSVDELARRKLKCIMLNLGSGPRAWRLLRTLRERVGTRAVPILAYAMPPAVGAGFCFGRADFAVWPIDPPRLIERLGRLRPKLRRVMALTADIDGMGRLRSALSQAKISTSIMLDGKQALEFAAMVEPEAAILHLSPACPSAPRALAGFRAAEATRDLPLLLLLDKVAASAEDAFFAATVRQLLGKPTFQFTNLPEEIARVIG